MYELLCLAKENETEDFCTGLDLEQPIRLRTYDPKLNVMLKPFEDNNKTLLEENIYSHFIFKIEQGEFEEYDPDERYVRILNWNDLVLDGRAADEDQSYDLQALDTLPF